MAVLYGIANVTLVLSIWGVLFLMFAGLGLPFVRSDKKQRPMLYWLQAFWPGWCIAIAFLMLWNFFAPINNTSFAALGFISLGNMIGLLSRKDRRDNAVVSLPPAESQRGILVAVCLGCVVYMALLSLQCPGVEMADAGMYHLSAIKWANEFPALPGLGNVHGRLAFNNSSFLYCALINAGPWPVPAYHLANGLLSAVLFCQIAQGAFDRTRTLPERWFYRALLATVPFLVGYSGVTPDHVAFVLCVVAAIELLNCWRGEEFAIFRVILIAAALITVKLNGAVFAGGAVLWAFFGPWKLRRIRLHRWLGGFAFAAIISGWMIRNICLSGHLIYPIASLALDVDWRVPTAIANEEYNCIVRWGRLPAPPDD